MAIKVGFYSNVTENFKKDSHSSLPEANNEMKRKSMEWE